MRPVEIDRQISALENALSAVDGRGRGGRQAARETAKERGRKGMSAATRKAVSKRMKACWAKRCSQAKAKKQ